MRTLGVSSAGDEHAAVVVDGGETVSAIHAGPLSGGAAGCIQEALDVAGLRLGDMDRVIATDAAALADHGVELVDRHRAQAAQLRARAPGSAVVVLDDAATGRASLFLGNGADISAQFEGCTALRTMALVARALGLTAGQPITALESIATVAGSDRISAAATGSRFELALDESAVNALLRDAAMRSPVPLDTIDSPHVVAQQIRGTVATAVLDGLAALIASAAGRAGGSNGIAFAGGAFASAAFAARVQQHTGGDVAPVHDVPGAALGAALEPHPSPKPLTHLALGRAFSEIQIKLTLDRCRLEYIYEPHWSRLLTRTSQLLETGALVAWFQGRADFGGSLGSRSVLCDPSHRYSRENVNVFLLNRPAHEPLPVSLSSAAGADPLRFTYAAADDHRGTAAKLVSAIDCCGRLLCHAPDAAAMPEMRALLDMHMARTGVPGLLNVPLLTNGRLTSTPLDAVREMFGSAADALVIGRFIVAKDYWLLRR